MCSNSHAYHFGSINDLFFFSFLFFFFFFILFVCLVSLLDTIFFFFIFFLFYLEYFFFTLSFVLVCCYCCFLFLSFFSGFCWKRRGVFFVRVGKANKLKRNNKFVEVLLLLLFSVKQKNANLNNIFIYIFFPICRNCSSIFFFLVSLNTYVSAYILVYIYSSTFIYFYTSIHIEIVCPLGSQIDLGSLTAFFCDFLLRFYFCVLFCFVLIFLFFFSRSRLTAKVNKEITCLERKLF